jgi:hypothetical protein
VKIIDDTSGTVVYNIPTPVTVTPNNPLANSLADSITNNDPYSPILLQLNSGNLNLIAKNVIALTTVFNKQSSSSASNKNENLTQVNQVNNQMAALREFLVSKLMELSVSGISSIKVISSALSAATQSPDQVSTKLAVKFIF